MDKKQRLHLLGVYNYTVILTYVGMLFSFAGIHFVFSNNDRSFILAPVSYDCWCNGYV